VTKLSLQYSTLVLLFSLIFAFSGYLEGGFSMNSDSIRKRGGQPGNQNACKHGFYSSVLKEKELPFLEEAAGVEGIDEEIAILRAKCRSYMVHHPDNIRLIVLAAESLARLIRTKYRIKDLNKQAGLGDVVGNILRTVIPAAGLDPAVLLKAHEKAYTFENKNPIPPEAK